MSADEPRSSASTRRAGRFWPKALAGLLAGSLVLSAALVGGSLWFVNRRATRGFDRLLRRYVETHPGAAGFSSAHVDLFRGRLTVKNPWIRRSSGSRGGIFSADEVSLLLPLQDLFAGTGTIREIRIGRPLVHFQPGAPGRGKGPLPGWLGRVAVEKVRIDDGAFLWEGEDGRVFKVEDVSAGIGGWGAGPLRGEFRGRLIGEKPGSLGGRFVIQSPFSPLTLEANLDVEGLSLALLGPFLTDDPEVRVLSGVVNLKSQVACRNDWLTASHLVEVRDLKIDPGSRRKLMGVSVKRLKEVLEVDYLSFVVPMNGDVTDPRVGAASSIEQILYKVLEGKMDREDADRWARRGGGYLGGKLDRAFRRWLTDGKPAPRP